MEMAISIAFGVWLVVTGPCYGLFTRSRGGKRK